MATKISDVIVPEVFNPYLIQKSVETNAFLSSGIATKDPTVTITKGGKTVNIPFWKRLSGKVEDLKDTAGLTLNKVDADSDVAAILARGVGYAVNDLAEVFSGDDPMGAIADMLGDSWNDELSETIISVLKGALGSAGMESNVNDQSSAVLTSKMMLDTCFKLGDNFKKITAVAMHSAVLQHLKNLDVIQTVQASTISPAYETYMDKRVIIDDKLAPTEDIYPIYFFGVGSIAYNENPALVRTEQDRDIVAGEDVITSRRYFTMHPRGIKWIGSPAGATPSNAELANTANWKLVENPKNVAITLLKAKLA